MQGNKCSNVYFIRYGRVKVLRNLSFVQPDFKPNLHNYQQLFADPT